MNKVVLFFGLSAVVALTGVVAACSSTTTVPVDPGPTEGGAKEGGGPADGGKDTSTIPDDTGTIADPDKACAALTTFGECGTCCVKNHTAGYKVFQDSLVACACKGTGADGGSPCATDCATTICKSPPANPDATCNTCLQGSVNTGGACQDKVVNDCTASPDCLAQQKCIVPCQSKPKT